MRYTPENITELAENEIFTFGSNERGIHGGGAAALAYTQFGARWGQGFGLAGKTFAIPSKDWQIETLDLKIIGFYVDRFLDFASQSDLIFVVTKVGAGLAGYTVEDMAPLFHKATQFSNIILPREFWMILDKGSNHKILPKT